MPDGRIYYLLHIKPSKFDRARVIPFGDGLGRVLAEIIRYVKASITASRSRFVIIGDLLEKRPRPPAPYLIPGIRHPSTAGIQTIRSRIREISIAAEARRSDGSPLVLLAHDCRRVFASEHLNNDTPRARHSSAARSRLSGHRDDLCQALPRSAHRRVPQDHAQSL
jgi:hypothetical protein